MNGLKESIASEPQMTMWNIHFQKTPSKLFWKEALTYNPAVVLINLCPRCMKTWISMEVCAWLSIIALFIIVKIWKQFRCPLMGEWLNWYTHTTEYYSAIKKEYIQQLQRVLRELSWVKQCQCWGYILCDFIYITFLKWQKHRNKARLVVARG